MQGLDGRGGGPQHQRGAAGVRLPFRHIARYVARSLVLLIRALVLFVDYDQPHVRQRCEQGAAGAHHHAGPAAANKVPLIEALSRAHTRMEHGHHVAEAPAEARHGLRGKRDFRNQHDGGASLGEHPLDGLQVHFRLTRPGYPVHHHDAAVACFARATDTFQRLRLPFRELGLGARHETLACTPTRRHPAHASAVLHHHDPARFQRLERRRDVPVFGDELAHTQGTHLQGRQDGLLLDGPLARLEVLRVGAQPDPAVVHLAGCRLAYHPLPVLLANRRSAAWRRE